MNFKGLKSLKTAFFLSVAAISLASCKSNAPITGSSPLNREAPSVVKIVKTEKGFELLRNGAHYFINGAGGSRYLDTLVKYGGNSIRTWSSSQRVLDKAHEKGLSVCMGLRMRKPRKGFDYTDKEVIRKQLDRVRRQVLRFKGHPSLLMWGIGNEVEHHASKEQRIRVWKAINETAKMIKQIDTNHPVITVIAGTGGGKLRELKQYCPALDAVGINSYGKLPSVPQQVQYQGWDKAYLVTEFGPRGWWEVDRTEWNLPIEDTSAEKAKFYYHAYQEGIKSSPNCLGSYVFLWGDKQEKTHTWFNLFLPDGSPTEVVDAMSRAWTGDWPGNRAPTIGPDKVKVRPAGANEGTKHIFPTNSKLHCEVDTFDPDGDEMIVKWDLRIDVSDNPSTGGDHEEATPPIEGAVVSSDGSRAVIQTPKREGKYRIFVYVYDDNGSAATANVPILVKNAKVH